MNLIQFNSHYQLKPGKEWSYRIYLEYEGLGAVVVSKRGDVRNASVVCRSYMPNRIDGETKFRMGLDTSERCNFNMDNPANFEADMGTVIRSKYGTKKLEVFRELSTLITATVERHIQKLESEIPADAKLEAGIAQMRQWSARITVALDDHGIDATAKKPQPQKKAINSPNIVLRCIDPGYLGNLTMDLFYEPLPDEGIDSQKYVKIKDDYGRERCFLRSRFREVEFIEGDEQ